MKGGQTGLAAPKISILVVLGDAEEALVQLRGSLDELIGQLDSLIIPRPGDPKAESKTEQVHSSVFNRLHSLARDMNSIVGAIRILQDSLEV